MDKFLINELNIINVSNISSIVICSSSVSENRYIYKIRCFTSDGNFCTLIQSFDFRFIKSIFSETLSFLISDAKTYTYPEIREIDKDY